MDKKEQTRSQSIPSQLNTPLYEDRAGDETKLQLQRVQMVLKETGLAESLP